MAYARLLIICLLPPTAAMSAEIGVAQGVGNSSPRIAAPQRTEELPDAGLRASIEESFRLQYILRDTKDRTLVQVMIQVDHPQISMAFDMSLRVGDETWPLGPVAWSPGRTRSWAYDTDLPEYIEVVDVVLVPSALAASKLKRQNPHWLSDLNEVWSGSPFVLPGIKVRSQRISMHRIPSPTTQAALEFALEHLDPADPVVQQLKADGDTAKARAQFQRNPLDNAQARYHFGCLETADGDLASALRSFAEVQRLNPPPKLRQQTQRQLRRICAMYLYQAEKEDMAAMYALGGTYERGWGVKQNFQEAKRWYRNAANAGNTKAMCRLASMYQHETGAPQRTEEAHRWYAAQTREWYRRAADLGDQEATYWLSAHDPGSGLPQFKPQSEIDARGFEHGGFFCLSPDGQQILFARGNNGPLQFWEPTTHELLAEVGESGIIWGGITYSPDGTQAAIQGIGGCTVVDTRTWQRIRQLNEPWRTGQRHILSSPQFTRDGRYLLLESGEPSLRIFDATSWQHVDRLPEVPEDALQYVPAAKSERALVRSKTGDVLLWDSTQQRQIAKLDQNVYIAEVSFSPDESLVAVVTTLVRRNMAYWGGPRIRIWNTHSGDLIHELRPFERAAKDRVEGITWSPDGRNILAATQPDEFSTSCLISVFGMKTGSHRGDFVGATGVMGIALLPDGSQLLAGCNGGKILFWEFQSALKHIRNFEASLTPRPGHP